MLFSAPTCLKHIFSQFSHDVHETKPTFFCFFLSSICGVLKSAACVCGLFTQRRMPPTYANSYEIEALKSLLTALSHRIQRLVYV